MLHCTTTASHASAVQSNDGANLHTQKGSGSKAASGLCSLALGAQAWQGMQFQDALKCRLAHQCSQELGCLWNVQTAATWNAMSDPKSACQGNGNPLREVGCNMGSQFAWTCTIEARMLMLKRQSVGSLFD